MGRKVRRGLFKNRGTKRTRGPQPKNGQKFGKEKCKNTYKEGPEKGGKRPDETRKTTPEICTEGRNGSGEEREKSCSRKRSDQQKKSWRRIVGKEKFLKGTGGGGTNMANLCGEDWERLIGRQKLVLDPKGKKKNGESGSGLPGFGGGYGGTTATVSAKRLTLSRE